MRIDGIKIKPRLIGAFALISLISVFIGWNGVSALNKAKTIEDRVVTNDLPIVEAANEIRANMLAVHLAARTAAYNTDKPKEVAFNQGRIDQGLKGIEDQVAVIDKLTLTDQAGRLWQGIKSNYAQWKSATDNTMALAVEGKGEEARAVSFGTARDTYLNTEGPIKELIEISDKSVKAGDSLFDSIVSRSRTTNIVLIVLGLILSLTFGFVISLSVANPVKNLSLAANTLAVGDTSVDIDSNAKDEIGELGRAFRAMIDNIKAQAQAAQRIAKGDLETEITPRSDKDILGVSMAQALVSIKSMVTEAESLTQAQITGKLDTRANTSNFQGGYKTLMEGINRTLDTIVGNFEAIPTPIQFVDKEFRLQYINETGAKLLGSTKQALMGQKCSAVWHTKKCGTKQCPCQVAMDTNSVHTCDNECTVAGQDMHIFCAGAPLRDESGHVIGSFEFVTDQTEVVRSAIRANKVSEFQGAEVQKLVDGLTEMSKGNLEFDLNVADGDSDVEDVRKRFIALSQAVAGCVSAVDAMRQDVRTLSMAARNGELSTRVDASKHAGAYSKIVGGFNSTLDSMTVPINEAAAVLEKVADRDLTVRMNGDYVGDYAKIKEALNTAIENLERGMSQVAVGAEKVASASVQIGTGSQSLAEGASEQAGALEEISSALQEMSSMTKQNASNAKEARGMADGARNSADRGVESMRQLSEAMAKIKASSDETAKILKTIDEIAFQTNLLALNAAVEAARAGDAGKGFAVVAEEVRNLAMRSAEAAKNTADMIEGSVKNAEEGVTINAEAMKNLEEINDQARKVSEMISEIAVASDQQSQGIEQVNVAVEQMDQLTQQNAANSEQSASAADELSTEAQEMLAMVAGFQLSASTTYTAAQNASRTSNARRESAQPTSKPKRGRKPEASTVIPLDDMEALSEF